MEEEVSKYDLEKLGIVKDVKLTTLGAVALVYITFNVVNKILSEWVKELSK